MLSQVTTGGLWSSLCFGHLSAGELEHPCQLAVFIQRTRGSAFSRLRGNLSSHVWMKAIITVNGLSQQQSSFLFLCSSGEAVANPWPHRETPLRAWLCLTSRLQLSFIFCGLCQTVWGTSPLLVSEDSRATWLPYFFSKSGRECYSSQPGNHSASSVSHSRSQLPFRLPVKMDTGSISSCASFWWSLAELCWLHGAGTTWICDSVGIFAQLCTLSRLSK